MRHIRFNILYALQDLGGYDLEKISGLSARELEQRRGVGKRSVAKLRTFLQSKGLDLKE